MKKVARLQGFCSRSGSRAPNRLGGQGAESPMGFCPSRVFIRARRCKHSLHALSAAPLTSWCAALRFKALPQAGLASLSRVKPTRMGFSTFTRFEIKARIGPGYVFTLDAAGVAAA